MLTYADAPAAGRQDAGAGAVCAGDEGGGLKEPQSASLCGLELLVYAALSY